MHLNPQNPFHTPLFHTTQQAHWKKKIIHSLTRMHLANVWLIFHFAGHTIPILQPCTCLAHRISITLQGMGVTCRTGAACIISGRLESPSHHRHLRLVGQDSRLTPLSLSMCQTILEHTHTHIHIPNIQGQKFNCSLG